MHLEIDWVEKHSLMMLSGWIWWRWNGIQILNKNFYQLKQHNEHNKSIVDEEKSYFLTTMLCFEDDKRNSMTKRLLKLLFLTHQKYSQAYLTTISQIATTIADTRKNRQDYLLE